MEVLITGGAGFVGSNFIRYALRKHADWEIVNLDKLTYAGNLENLRDIANSAHYRFVKGDIADSALVDDLFKSGFDLVVNLAAETHVDRSILDPTPFVDTNMKGTQIILDAARKFGATKIIHISTPEVYGGSSPYSGRFKEDAPLQPNNPYSASKAGGDLLCRAYGRTYGLKISLTRFANAYGPYQYPEKLLPLTITKAMKNEPIPLYGDGLDRRNWIFVDDVCHAIDMIIEKGRPGEVYNIGSDYEMTNLDLVNKVLEIMGKPRSFIKFVPNRPAHDWQYVLDSTKIKTELGWELAVPFDEAVTKTIKWYETNRLWWERLQVLDYADYYQKLSKVSGG